MSSFDFSTTDQLTKSAESLLETVLKDNTEPDGVDHIGIAAGSLDLPTGMTPGKHIFTADCGDYYTIPDDAPHIPD